MEMENRGSWLEGGGSKAALEEPDGVVFFPQVIPFVGKKGKIFLSWKKS